MGGALRKPFLVTQFFTYLVAGYLKFCPGSFSLWVGFGLRHSEPPQRATSLSALESIIAIMYVIHLFDSHNNPFYKWQDETWGFARGDTDLVSYAVGTSSGFRKGPLPAMLMRLKRPALLGEVPLKAKADWAQDEDSPCSQRVRTQSSKMGSSLNIHTSHVYWALVLSKADRVPVLGNGSAGRENIHQTFN